MGSDPSSRIMHRHVIDFMEFSCCGQYLAVRHQIYPETLWVLDIRTNGIDILILQNIISGKYFINFFSLSFNFILIQN
jgi:hypothetical protein